MTEATTAAAPAPGRGSEGQTFLISENLYLRGFEKEDAKHARAWRSAPYPISAERAEEILKKQETERGKSSQRPFLAVRRVDDVPVGSVVWHTHDWRSSYIDVYANPALGKEQVSAVKAELLRLFVPYLLNERHQMVVVTEMADGDPALQAAARDAGMEQTVRLRESFYVDGCRRDCLIYETLNPAWIPILGDPREGDAALLESIAAQRAEFAARPEAKYRVGSVPASAWPANPPRNAFAIGERVYLRPLEIEDAKEMADWERREPETFFDNGRGVAGSMVYAQHVRQIGEDDQPDWIRFAICLREGDVLLGSNGIEEVSLAHRYPETESFIHRPEYRGGGYGTEAKHLLLEYAFDVLGMHGVRSFVFEQNTRSAAALRKQGYRDAGFLHWDTLKDAHYYSFLVFDYLASEWRALRDAANG